MSHKKLQEGLARALIRSRFKNPEAPVEKCDFKECDTAFVGMTAEDYAVHLVEEHQGLYARPANPDGICEQVARMTIATRDSEVSA